MIIMLMLTTLNGEIILTSFTKTQIQGPKPLPLGFQAPQALQEKKNDLEDFIRSYITPNEQKLKEQKVFNKDQRVINKNMNKKIFSDVKHYLLEKRYLFKVCVDNIIRKCVPEEKMRSILHYCHDRESGRHFGTTRIATKVLQSGFYWPSLFKDAHRYMS